MKFQKILPTTENVIFLRYGKLIAWLRVLVQTRVINTETNTEENIMLKTLNNLQLFRPQKGVLHQTDVIHKLNVLELKQLMDKL